MKTDFEVVIVGGGIVGLILACFLGQRGFQVLVLEANAWVFPNEDSTDLRVSAINFLSQQLLETVGAWDLIASPRKTPYLRMTVWDHVGNGRIEFDAASMPVPQLGHIIENNQIVLALHKICLSLPTITLVDNAHPVQIEPEEPTLHDFTKITYQSFSKEHAVKTKLIVGADGAHSWVRKQAGIDIKIRSYDQTALIATVKTEKPHLQTARQIFLETGPLAFLPLHEPTLCSLVWTTTPEHALALKSKSASLFCQALSSAFRYTLGRVETASDRAIFPLVARHVKNTVKSRVALVGDAAHTIHPLAGQGLNLGLADAKALGETIIKNRNKDFGHYFYLREYERVRKGSNYNMLMGMRVLKELFSGNALPKVFIRNAGLDFVNACQPVKKFFMKEAMGL